MRSKPNDIAEPFRQIHPTLGASESGWNYGYFCMDGLRIIASDGDETGWEHVSVSMPHRCPTWKEMCKVKDLFWNEDETVLQFHPRRGEYVNRHPFVLHLWKRAGIETVLPPKELIG